MLTSRQPPLARPPCAARRRAALRPPRRAPRPADRRRRASPRRSPADRAAPRRGARRLAHRGARGGAPAASRAASCARARARASTSPPPPRARRSTLDLSLIASLDDVMRVREVRARARGRDRGARRRARDAARQVAACAGRFARSTAAPPRRATASTRTSPSIACSPQAAGNPHFGRLLEFLEQYSARRCASPARNDATPRDFVEAVRLEHRAIVDAIAAGDPALARRRALQHMRGGDRRMRTAAPIARQAH